jgi:hypothetical protein
VPKYHFHISDGARELTDKEGREFTGLRAARAHAAVVVRDAKAALCEKELRDLSGWTLRVTDARGRTVFRLGFDLRPKPLSPPEPNARRATPAPVSIADYPE